MERPKNLSISTRTSVIVIILFHLVGLTGLSASLLKPLFLQIVPWHILLMLLVVSLTNKNDSSRFAVFVVIITTSGFALEWFGVHKYWIFGDYIYGKTLGLKLFDIPLIIGVNWFLLIYATGVTMQHSRLKNAFFKVITGAVILVLLDLLIEPVAMNFDYWHWDSNVIPIKNYVCWFLVSAIFLYVFELFKFKKQSIVPSVLLITQFVFFALLNVLVQIKA
jgi:putative membrane protein